MSRGIQDGPQSDVDVIVIGGGPAGSTVSTLIAQRGYRVELFERERFPRFHIGESLIPETYWVLERLARAGALPAALRELGASKADLPALAADAATQWTGTFNPRPFDQAAALDLYERAY